MSDNHDEHDGPIHQAGWVFYLTVAVCYAVLGVIMLAKFAVDGVEFGDIVKMFAIEGVVLAVFLAVFGGILFAANKAIGAATSKE